jgi:hypothetical protein
MVAGFAKKIDNLFVVSASLGDGQRFVSSAEKANSRIT